MPDDVPLSPSARCSPWTTGFRLAASLAAAALSLGIARYVYLGQPATTDENSYLFQAHTFSEGRLRRAVPDPAEIYWYRMVISDDTAGWVSRYPPGHPLWLTLGVWLGNPRLAVALAAGLSVWLLTGCALLLGAPVWPTALLLLISPYFLFMHGTLLSHTSGLTAAALMLWGYLRWRRRDRLDGAAIAGLAWAFFFLNRTYTALLVAVPFGLDALWALWRAPGRRHWRGTALFAGCAALGVLALLGYNRLITGSAFLTPYDYYDPREGLGFGERSWATHTLARGLEHLAGNSRALDQWLLLGGGALWLFGLLAVLGWTRRWSRLALGAILMILAGYVFFFCPGLNTCGPFYYFETLPFFALLWMLATRRLFDRARRPAWRRAAAGLLLAFLAAAAALSARFMRREAARIAGRQADLARLDRVVRGAPSNSLIIVENMPAAVTERLVFNPRGPASDPLLFLGLDHYNLLITAGLAHRAAFFLRPDSQDRLVPVTNRLAFAHRIAWHHMPHQTGRPTGPGDDPAAGRRAAAPADDPGYLAMGQYVSAPPGRYRVEFDLETGPAGTADPCATLDVCAERGRRILAQADVGCAAGRTNICLAFALPNFTELEPRVLFRGGAVTFRGVALENIADP